MKVTLSVPSKTFLIGEYAVLGGGPSLIAATAPRFSLHIDTLGQSQIEGINPSSPGGQWVRAHKDDFLGASCRFVDPFEGAGGFGASSAQYVLSYAWSLIKKTSFADLANGLDTADLWKSYQALDHRGVSPSGGDVVAQALGGVCHFVREPLVGENREWPFKDLEFALFKTGKKIATHTHLASLKPPNLLQLVAGARRAFDALVDVSDTRFISAVRDFASEIERLELLSPQVKEQINLVRRETKVLACKGCGALGADVVVAFYRPPDSSIVKETAENAGLTFIATSKQLSHGLGIEVELEARGGVDRRMVLKGTMDV